LERDVGVEETAVIEGGQDLYQITPLPPGMLMCVNAAGGSRLLNRNRSTIWNYVKTGRLRSFSIAGNIAIPLVDIAGVLGVSETQVYNAAVVYRLPLWQIHPEGV